jgi:hypothetical protein
MTETNEHATIKAVGCRAAAYAILTTQKIALFVLYTPGLLHPLANRRLLIEISGPF